MKDSDHVVPLVLGKSTRNRATAQPRKSAGTSFIQFNPTFGSHHFERILPSGGSMGTKNSAMCGTDSFPRRQSHSADTAHRANKMKITPPQTSYEIKMLTFNARIGQWSDVINIPMAR